MVLNINMPQLFWIVINCFTQIVVFTNMRANRGSDNVKNYSITMLAGDHSLNESIAACRDIGKWEAIISAYALLLLPLI